MRVRNYQQAVDAIYPRLEDYLIDKGYDTKKLFTCLSTDHDDSNPSCGIVPSGDAWNCFGCGASGTIFNAINAIEGMPINGQGFVTETLPFLAEMYGVALEHEPLTEEELYELDTYRAYRIASELVVSGKHTPEFDKALEDRKWSPVLCHQLGIGSIPDHRKFRESLKQAGFTAQFLNEVDLNRESIFGADRLVFTIRDADGRAVGFASRDLNYVEGNGNAKYINQKSTGVKCNIYQKSKRLFGLSNFLEKKGRKNIPLFLFEGYGDVTTANQYGLWNCAAIGGTALTQDHISVLKEHNIYDVVLCLDGDKAGQDATARLLDSVLSGHKDFKVSIIIIPEQQDPDEFIQAHGIDKFKKLTWHSAFKWRLSQFDENEDSSNICTSMIPLIVNETSYIVQEQMCHELAQMTGITLKNIQRELDRLQDVKDAAKAREVENIGEKLTREIAKEPLNIQHFIQEADANLYDIARKYEEDAFSEDAFVARILGQKDYEEALDGSFTGFILSSDLHELEQNLAGNWKKDVWMVIGGKPNCFPIDTEFVDPNTGRMVTAKELTVVNSLGTDSTIEVKEVDYLATEPKECFEVTVQRGYKTITSLDHRYLTPFGYKKLGELEVGDSIAQPTKLDVKSEKVSHADNYSHGLLLGLMIGDGNYTQSRPLFCNDDPEIFSKLEHAVKRFDTNLNVITYDTILDNPTYRMVGITQKDWKSKRNKTGQCMSNPLTNWFKQLGIYGQKKEHKIIPQSVFTEHPNFIKGVLSGLFSSDGSVYSYVGKFTKHTIEFCSISEKLARQVQHLLLRFGINSALSYKKNNHKGAWIVKFSNHNKIYRFANEIGFVGRKNKRLNNILPELKCSQQSSVIEWAKIKSITPVGIQDCCDITVSNNHNFIVDGFVLHNSGKTSFMCKLMWDIASKEEENDACVIYHTIDDTFEQVLPKFICLGRGNTRLELNHVMNPNYAARDSFENDVHEDRNDGYNKIIDLAKRGRLIVKDANDGVSISYADNLIRRMKEKYPGRNIVYVLDNFHKLSDFQGMRGDERTRFKELSKVMKGLATKHHICVITTVEYRKTQDNRKAGNQDISETIQIEYDANLIAHVHNELHEKGAAATMVHRSNAKERLPIIEVQVGKNKITSFKDRMYFQFFPSSSSFIGASAEMVNSFRLKEKEAQGGDDENHKELYAECAEICNKAKSKPSRTMFLMMERLDMDKDDSDDRKKGWDIYNKCGGDEGVAAFAA